MIGSLLLITIFLLAIGAVLLVGQQQPMPERVARLHLNDCALPCWNEITPRVSSLNDVERRITTTFPDFKHLSSVNLPFQSWRVDNLKPNDTSIEIAVDDGRVFSVNIGMDVVSDEMPTLGEVLAVFGIPLCVNVEAQSGNAIFTYESSADRVIVQVLSARPSLFSPVKSIYVGGSTPFTCQQVLALSWPEFRRAQRWFASTS